MPAGRPTKYNAQMQEQAETYINEARDLVNAMPTIEELSLRLDVDEDTMGAWEKVNPRFLGTLNKLRALQRQRLKTMGLFNRVNSTMAIFLLKANHGMVETTRSEIDQKTEHSGGITVKVTKFGEGDATN